MARKRSRKVNFKGTSGEHLREAKESLNWATKKLRDVGAAVSKGHCRTAVHLLTTARFEIGRAKGNLVGSGKVYIDGGPARTSLSARLDRLDRLAFGMARRFIDKCVPRGA